MPIQAIENRTKEIRMFSNIFEIREKENGKKEIEGYALEWETLSEELGWWWTFREKFRKGAFREYLDNKDTDTKLLISHNNYPVLGRSKHSTLELKEDNTGLWFRADLPNNTFGNDVHESVKRRDLDGISVGFIMKKEEWDEEDDENVVRTVIKAELPEISLTSFPAYESSSVGVREKRENDPYKLYKDKQNRVNDYNKRLMFLREVSINE